MATIKVMCKTYKTCEFEVTDEQLEDIKEGVFDIWDFMNSKPMGDGYVWNEKGQYEDKAGDNWDVMDSFIEEDIDLSFNLIEE